MCPKIEAYLQALRLVLQAEGVLVGILLKPIIFLLT